MKDWVETVSKQLTPKMQMLLCVIPGIKGKGHLYYDVKKYLLSSIPIPSQVILTGTMTKRKDLINF